MRRRFLKGTKNPDRCRHRWQPVTIEVAHVDFDPRTGRQYEMQWQPSLEHAPVYLVCLRCASWCYMDTAYAGVQMEGSLFREPGDWETREYRDWLKKRAEEGA